MKYKYFTLAAFCAILCATAQQSVAQDLKYLDQQNALAESKVRGANSIEIRYSGNSVADTIPKGQAEFDLNGRITQYTEFFARGRKAAVFHYFYDSNGHLASASVAHRQEDFKPVPFIMEFDEKGRIITRWPVRAIQDFWVKEIFTYASNGVMVKATQIYANGERTYQEFPATMMPGENSYSFLYDQHGLLQTQLTMNKQGNVESVIRFKYHFD